MLALALVLVLLVTSGQGPLRLSSTVARQELSAAMTHHSSAPAVHERGTFSRDGHRQEVDVTIDRDGDSQGVVVSDGRRIEYRFVGGRAYVLAGQQFWADSQGKLASFLADRWVTGPDVAQQTSTQAMTRGLALLDVARPGSTFTTRGRPTTVGGMAAVALSDRYGELYVSTGDPRRFLRLVSAPSYRTVDGIADVRIDLDYPRSVKVEVPSPVVDTDDPASMPARYMLDDASYQHGRDCDVASTCTISVNVLNQGGPQVGDPSAEVHLVRDDGSDLGTCTTAIRPVGHGQTERVSCTVTGRAWVDFTRVGGRYRAAVTVHNPLYDG